MQINYFLAVLIYLPDRLKYTPVTLENTPVAIARTPAISTVAFSNSAGEFYIASVE